MEGRYSEGEAERILAAASRIHDATVTRGELERAAAELGIPVSALAEAERKVRADEMEATARKEAKVRWKRKIAHKFALLGKVAAILLPLDWFMGNRLGEISWAYFPLFILMAVTAVQVAGLLLRGPAPVPPPVVPQVVDSALVARIVAHHGPDRLAAIKELRDMTGLGLKEAKDVIDAAYGRF